MIGNLLQKLDSTAGIRKNGRFVVFLERAAFVFLILMILMSPHSIAATQTMWLLGMLFWIARHLVRPLPKTKGTFLVVPILALYGWTVVSSIVSYAPDISMGKVRGAALFLIFFYAFNQLRTRKSVRLSAGALILSCMINVFWVPLERLIGKGVQIQGVAVEGPLYKAGFRDGFSLFKANDRRLERPADIVEEIERSGEADIRYYFDGHYWQFKVSKENLLPGKTALEKLGIEGWSKSRSWRSSGFYGMYSTYADVVQQIGSLTFGLLTACLGLLIFESRRRKDRVDRGLDSDADPNGRRKLRPGRGKGAGLTLASALLALFVMMMSVALLLTITRASQVGFVVSLFVIVLVGGGRQIRLALLAVSIPAIIGGTIFLQQTRGVGFLDLKDSSTTWRLTVYREGLDLWTKSPRNFTFGVGMDSIKRYAREWRLFDDGKIQIGHFHSTPIQLVVERGFPALLFWLWLFGAYLWRLFLAIKRDRFADWIERGIVLGAFGGTCGFLVSSLVHYNYGDEEVIMVLYLIMAMAVSILTFTPRTPPEDLPSPR